MSLQNRHMRCMFVRGHKVCKQFCFGTLLGNVRKNTLMKDRYFHIWHITYKPLFDNGKTKYILTHSKRDTESQTRNSKVVRGSSLGTVERPAFYGSSLMLSIGLCHFFPRLLYIHIPSRTVDTKSCVIHLKGSCWKSVIT